MTMEQRVGIGYDSHRFGPGGPMRLGGIDIPSSMHCAGHSDGDALGDIGEMFPDTDPANKGADSVAMLVAAVRRLHQAGWHVGNVDITVVTQQPKIGPHRQAMREALSSALGVTTEAVFVKGKTNEHLGWIGREEGLAVIATASIVRARS
jgi:2-C-methyl-D-erythritol 2,4-cyclodiphosphate synthase